MNLLRDFASMGSRLQSLFPAKNDFTLFEKRLIAAWRAALAARDTLTASTFLVANLMAALGAQ